MLSCPYCKSLEILVHKENSTFLACCDNSAKVMAGIVDRQSFDMTNNLIKSNLPLPTIKTGFSK